MMSNRFKRLDLNLLKVLKVLIEVKIPARLQNYCLPANLQSVAHYKNYVITLTMSCSYDPNMA